jgi:hypothetical protein
MPQAVYVNLARTANRIYAQLANGMVTAVLRNNCVQF